MTVRGHVKNGLVVLDTPTTLPDGAEVEVRLTGEDEQTGDDAPRTTLYERLKPFVRRLEGLPSDLTENHDHYLYGTPKRDE